MEDLEPGDFLYQSDQELFLVVVEENEDSYTFAAHGWRDIGKKRLKEYISDPKSNIHTQPEVEHVVADEGNDEDEERLEDLKALFSEYRDVSLSEDTSASYFSMDDQ